MAITRQCHGNETHSQLPTAPRARREEGGGTARTCGAQEQEEGHVRCGLGDGPRATGDIDVAPRALLHVDAIEPDGEGADVGALGAAVEQNRVDMDVPDHHAGVRLGVPLVCRSLVQPPARRLQ